MRLENIRDKRTVDCEECEKKLLDGKRLLDGRSVESPSDFHGFEFQTVEGGRRAESGGEPLMGDSASPAHPWARVQRAQ